MEQILVPKRDAASALGVSLRTVENLIAAKRLLARRIGRRTLVLRASIERLAKGDVPNPSALAKAAETRKAGGTR